MSGESLTANMCPGCGGWFGDTWTGFGCGKCGFYFDHEHLTEEQTEELEEIRDRYEKQQSRGHND